MTEPNDGQTADVPPGTIKPKRVTVGPGQLLMLPTGELGNVTAVDDTSAFVDVDGEEVRVDLADLVTSDYPVAGSTDG